MRAELRYGHLYRALVAIPAPLRAILPPATIEAELRRYQLFGRVSDIGTGYQVEAEFRGKTGTYDLPAEVTSFEIVR